MYFHVEPKPWKEHLKYQWRKGTPLVGHMETLAWMLYTDSCVTSTNTRMTQSILNGANKKEHGQQLLKWT